MTRDQSFFRHFFLVQPKKVGVGFGSYLYVFILRRSIHAVSDGLTCPDGKKMPD